MDITHLLVFAAAYLAVVLLPGPGVTALVARVLTRGTHGAPAYIAGFVTGSLLWFTVAAAGLAALASAFGVLFTVIRYAGAIYLVYLAWKFWTAPARPFDAADTSPEGRWSLFLAGAAINLGNPKAVVFFLGPASDHPGSRYPDSSRLRRAFSNRRSHCVGRIQRLRGCGGASAAPVLLAAGRSAAQSGKRNGLGRYRRRRRNALSE